MSNDWDQGWDESIDDGHLFADRHLSDEVAEHPMHRSEKDDRFDRNMADINASPGPEGRARRLQPGMVEAKHESHCAVCHEPIRVNDPIMKAELPTLRLDWRHADCGPAALHLGV